MAEIYYPDTTFPNPSSPAPGNRKPVQGGAPPKVRERRERDREREREREREERERRELTLIALNTCNNYYNTERVDTVEPPVLYTHT